MNHYLPDPPTKIKVLSGRIAQEQESDVSSKKVNSKKPRRPRENPGADTNLLLSIMTSTSEDVEPLYIDTPRALEEVFREMHSCFEGKESEQNWSRREKNIVKLRRVTKGNSPQDFTVAYLAGIKALLDGILKTVNSLRTTVCSHGCNLVQDIAKAAGPGLDNMVEILLQSLVKLCASTKKIAASNGDASVSAVITNVTYNVRIAQHIWAACQDKNVQPRSFATGWLKSIITKHRHHKNILEHGGSLELIEKCIKAGLTDRDPKVRESMRPTYWAFARLWAEKAEAISSTLEEKQRKFLIDDPSNPRPQKELAPDISATGAKVLPFSRSTNSIPTRPSIKETIAAQKRAKMAGKALPDRPGSAEPSATPMKPMLSHAARPATAMSTIGNLSSAPVRPMRPARRPEMKRPGTADPHSSRRPVRLSPTKTAEDVRNSPSSGKMSSQSSSVKPHDIPPIMKAVIPKQNGIQPKAAHKNDGPRLVKDASQEDACNADVPQGHSPPGRPQRISMTPRPISSKKETLNPRLKVYEDPSGGAETITTSPSIMRPTVLEELPVNEPPIYQPRLASNYPLLAEEAESPLYHRKWINVENAARHVSDSDKTENPYLMRRILDSAIAGVRAGTLDVHKFRKLQALIRSEEDIWEEGVKFDELLQPLLENLESPTIGNDLRPSSTSARVYEQIQTQVLMTIRLLQQHQPQYFSAYYSRALCAVILARKHHHSTSHIVCGLEETSETIVAQCDPAPCIDAVLDILETETETETSTAASTDGTLFMGLYVLAGLLHRVCSLAPQPSSTTTLTASISASSPKPCRHHLPTALNQQQQFRLGHLATRYLRNTNPDIRRAVIEFALELHDSVAEAGLDGFWKLVGGASEDQRSLITYYLARRERGRV